MLGSSLADLRHRQCPVCAKEAGFRPCQRCKPNLPSLAEQNAAKITVELPENSVHGWLNVSRKKWPFRTEPVDDDKFRLGASGSQHSPD